jgi:hypothetical protein
MGFEIGDVVVCIKSQHPYHGRRPVIGRTYIVDTVPYRYYGAEEVFSITEQETGKLESYITSCFVHAKDITAYDKVIYNVM